MGCLGCRTTWGKPSKPSLPTDRIEICDFLKSLDYTLVQIYLRCISLSTCSLTKAMNAQWTMTPTHLFDLLKIKDSLKLPESGCKIMPHPTPLTDALSPMFVNESISLNWTMKTSGGTPVFSMSRWFFMELV